MGTCTAASAMSCRRHPRSSPSLCLQPARIACLRRNKCRNVCRISPACRNVSGRIVHYSRSAASETVTTRTVIMRHRVDGWLVERSLSVAAARATARGGRRRSRSSRRRRWRRARPTSGRARSAARTRTTRAARRCSAGSRRTPTARGPARRTRCRARRSARSRRSSRCDHAAEFADGEGGGASEAECGRRDRHGHLRRRRTARRRPGPTASGTMVARPRASVIVDRHDLHRTAHKVQDEHRGAQWRAECFKISARGKGQFGGVAAEPRVAHCSACSRSLANMRWVCDFSRAIQLCAAATARSTCAGRGGLFCQNSRPKSDLRFALD